MSDTPKHTLLPVEAVKAAYHDEGEWAVATKVRYLAIVNDGVHRAEADARRLAACWNFCLGLSQEQLDGLLQSGLNAAALVDSRRDSQNDSA
ncbi:MAG: hypothetical protein M3416_03755 [Acidobacteriota bacterium]|nr:hypothetical protein [Acidobacteriota bacterium]